MNRNRNAERVPRCSQCTETAVGEYGVMADGGDRVLPYCRGHELDVLRLAAEALRRLTARRGPDPRWA